MISLTRGSPQFRVHDNVTVLVFNSHAARSVLRFLTTVCVNGFNGAIRVLPSLELGSM